MARRPSSAMATKTDIAALIRDRITGGRLALGERISDRALAEDLNVSRTPVREALLQLQGEGLVVMKPQSGTFVFDSSDEDIRELCVARTVMETGAIRVLCARDDREALGQLGMLVGQAAVALEEGDLDACYDLDCKLHESLVGATANRYLIAAYAGLSSKLRALRTRMPRERDRLAAAIEQHRRILDLCAADRVERAVEELSDHVGNVERLLVAARQARAAAA